MSKINQLKQINGFWRSHEINSFSVTEIALYFHLLKICNICGNESTIKRNNAKIIADLSISFNTLKNARNRLAQSGILSFKTQNGNANVIYTLSNFDEVTNEVTNEINKRKTKDETNLNFKEKKKKEKFDFEKTLIEDFNCDNQHVRDWMQVRKTKKAANTETALSNFINECQKNNFSVSEAVKICAERSWQGFKYEWLENNKQKSSKSLEESQLNFMNNFLNKQKNGNT